MRTQGRHGPAGSKMWGTACYSQSPGISEGGISLLGDPQACWLPGLGTLSSSSTAPTVVQPTTEAGPKGPGTHNLSQTLILALLTFGSELEFGQF